VGGRVRVLTQVSDAELESLYAACEFTAFPSLTEGWGLPVGESLARGRLCVTSARGSLPEVGGPFAIYLDPADVAAAVPVFRRLLEVPGALATAEAGLAGFRPRLWPEVAGAMLDALEAQPLPPPGRTLHAALPPGRSRPPAHGAPPADAFRHPLRHAFAAGWQVPEGDGAALAEPLATLQLAAPAAGRLRLELHASQPLQVTVRHNGAAATALVGPADPVALDLALPAGAVRVVLSVQLPDGLPPPDGPPGLRLATLGFTADG
jgi:hypothetical protein